MPKILIADDSQFMRQVLIDILKSNGYDTIIEAHDGQQAVELYEAEKPDLVILDIIMPEMDGLEVLKKIAPQGASVVVVSAVGQETVISEAKESAKGYIIKPFDEDQVLEEVKKALG